LTYNLEYIIRKSYSSCV